MSESSWWLFSVDGGHGINGTTPTVDLLSAISDLDHLTGLITDDFQDDARRILRFVKEDEVVFQRRFGKRPNLQIAVRPDR